MNLIISEKGLSTEFVRELLDLVRVKGIGRVRARVLYKNNIRHLDDLAKIPVNKLAEIDKIGSTIADNIKTELRRIRY